VGQLLKLVSIKALCRRAHVEKVDAGPKGVIVAFRDNSFANPQGLVRLIAQQGPDAKVRPDMKVVFMGEFATPDARLEGARAILRALAEIAEGKKPGDLDIAKSPPAPVSAPPIKKKHPKFRR
jgi:transcription-repair coupling factor (superfamily II helicase)